MRLSLAAQDGGIRAEVQDDNPEIIEGVLAALESGATEDLKKLSDRHGDYPGHLYQLAGCLAHNSVCVLDRVPGRICLQITPSSS